MENMELFFFFEYKRSLAFGGKYGTSFGIGKGPVEKLNFF